ncbi:MerR family transcriptional regulator [Nocardia sp. CA2R105]|uniref:MerR family transcriptional regulator n=1 Tax=Nocardia coffeae TaxID=2873381 RepID=UPI001CA77E00|nr:MerR family transcriptional regulator [Nocardia coffeae]MBY8859823.1 MerR family transcriptional regulator [Nocardia coffeae]
MAWSTRQLAELADSTVKAIRHYHEIGLLDVPERASNGYKQYKITHLVRLMQIKRLSDLGVPLSRIAEMERADQDPDEAIRVLDAELAATAERIDRVRTELAALRRHRAPMHVPPEFAPISRQLSQAQQSLLLAYSTVFSEETMAEFRRMISVPDDTEDEFESLPANADDAAIENLAERMLPVIREKHAKHPRLQNPAADSPRGVEPATNTMAQAVAEFYNPAQLRVLQRLNTLLQQATDTL